MKKLLFILLLVSCQPKVDVQEIKFKVVYLNDSTEEVTATYYSNDSIKFEIKNGRVFINNIPTKLYNVKQIIK